MTTALAFKDTLNIMAAIRLGLSGAVRQEPSGSRTPIQPDRRGGSSFRVLHVLNELKPSGAETMLAMAAPIFSRCGIQSDVFVKGEETGPYADVLESCGYSILHLPLMLRSILSFSVTFIKCCRIRRYHAIHIHSEHANLLLMVLARAAGVRTVVRTIHNVFLFDGLLRHRRVLERAFARFLGVHQVSVGKSVHDNEVDRFRNRTHIIRNWFDPGRISLASSAQMKEARDSLSIKVDDFVLISVGNCSKVKNHTDLIRAIALLAGRIPMRYLHIGLETSDHDEQRLAMELGIYEMIRFLGPVHDIEQYFHASNVYVMPSHHEGFSISAIEALAGGLPAVLTDVPGLRDFKNIAEDIEWCDPTPESIAAALIRTWEKKHPRPSHFSNNRRLLSSLYAANRNVFRYIAAYKTPCLDSDSLTNRRSAHFPANGDARLGSPFQLQPGSS
jgi:glycosyltransferase involved in cell wall biosynthesis